jgi:hypothetical protein
MHELCHKRTLAITLKRTKMFYKHEFSFFPATMYGPQCEGIIAAAEVADTDNCAVLCAAVAVFSTVFVSFVFNIGRRRGAGTDARENIYKSACSV